MDTKRLVRSEIDVAARPNSKGNHARSLNNLEIVTDNQPCFEFRVLIQFEAVCRIRMACDLWQQGQSTPPLRAAVMQRGTDKPGIAKLLVPVFINAVVTPLQADRPVFIEPISDPSR